MEDNKHGGIGVFVHNTVVQVSGDGAFRWWYNHALLSKSEVTSQNLADVHKLLPIWTWLGVGVMSRVASVDSKIRALAVACSIQSCVAPVETAIINNWHGGFGGAMEKTFLIVLVTISHFHVTLLNL